MAENPFPESDPRHYTRKVGDQLQDLVVYLRSDVTKAADPRGEALFETSAVVLAGLARAFADFERRDEPAWRAGNAARACTAESGASAGGAVPGDEGNDGGTGVPLVVVDGGDRSCVRLLLELRARWPAWCRER